jgi:hypothetical protein
VTVIVKYDSDSDKVSDDDEQQGNVADLSSEATFLPVVDLVNGWDGVYYRQVSEVVALTRSKTSGARSLLSHSRARLRARTSD